VDDDANQLTLRSALLKSFGYAVLEASTGDQCLQLSRTLTPSVILLGPRLPDIDPLEVCRQLKSDSTIGHILVVLISAVEPSSPLKSVLLQSRADGILKSPFSENELRTCLLLMERMRDRTLELETLNRALRRDMTEHEQATRRIKTSEVFFREITENSSDMILILNGRGIVIYASPSVERFLGYLPEEMIGQSSFRFIHPVDVERAKRDFSKAIRLHELAIPNSFRILHKDGTERILEGLGKNLLDNPAIAGFVMNVHDVTARKRLEESSLLFAHTLEGISDIVTVTDLDDRFTFVNQTFLNTYGYEREEVIGSHVGMLWSPNNPEGLLKEILEQNRTSNWNGELLNVTKDGREFPILLHTSRIRDEQGQLIGLVGISQDITERKKTEKEMEIQRHHLQESYEQLRQLEVARDNLLNMIVHDMRSRLVLLMVGLEFLEKHETHNITDTNRGVLRKGLSTARDLGQMVNSLLDVSKMESGKMKLTLKQCDLTEIAREVASSYELQRERRRFSIDAPPAPVNAVCDEDLVLRIVQNLFSNALKHTPIDGTITVRIQSLTGGQKVIVEDTGRGIDAYHLPKIFDRFYQVETLPGSTGIGLTFCKLAVEMHGGRIGVESTIGKGSRFWFTLPSKPGS
jgi:PAS domain S-box-containing protein